MNKILIVPKITKAEWDMHRLNFTEEELREFYKKEGLNAERIFDSHKKQKESLNRIRSLLPNADMVNRNDLHKDIIKDYDLVISFGGDNHFQYVSHFLIDVPILGINSDPERSEGALTNINSKDFEMLFKNILDNKFKIEKWTRLKVEIDDKEIEEFSVSEVFIGEERRFNMSRHILRIGNDVEEQKGSGLLITTGAGSTGWYNSASRYLFPEGDKFSKNTNEARFILTEPHDGKLATYVLLNGKMKDSDVLEITSLSDSSPYLSIDSLRLIELREGANIKIRIGNPLKVVVLK